MSKNGNSSIKQPNDETQGIRKAEKKIHRKKIN